VNEQSKTNSSLHDRVVGIPFVVVVVIVVCCVGSGLCDGLITRSGESYCMCLCVCVCVYVCVCVCELGTTTMRWPGYVVGCCGLFVSPQKNSMKNKAVVNIYYIIYSIYIIYYIYIYCT
jgi:hypothetical protein